MLSTVQLSQLNKGTSSLTVLLFLSLFLAGVDVATQDSDAGKKESESISKETSNSDDENEDLSETESGPDESSNTADAGELKESAIESENLSNITTNESITNTSAGGPYFVTNTASEGSNTTMTPFNLGTDNQISNQSQGDSNQRLTMQEKLSKGIIISNTTYTPPAPTYKVKVKFDSISVGDTHEGTLSGDGEYDLTAYVQGIKLGLTDRSFEGICGGSGDPLPCGLGDVSVGENVYFTPNAEVTVDVPATLPLSIFTVGEEVDSCDRKSHPDSLQDKLVAILQKPQNTWLDSIKKIVGTENIPDCDFGLFENINDRIGTIIKFYNAPDYGAGAHTRVVSDAGDFILRYTITVIPPQNFANKQFEPNMQSNNTFTFNK